MSKKAKHKLPPDATRIILESISEGVFTVDKDWTITSFNRAAETITGTSREDAIGRYCFEVLRSDLCETDCPLAKTMHQNEAVKNKSGYITNKQGEQIAVSISTALLRDGKDNILGGVETFRDVSDIEYLRKELKGQFRIGDIVSRSKSMYKIFQILPKVAASESIVLIQGDTGTGKELLARAIHHWSPRQEKPFVGINCGALPDNLLESELFGYKAGAFTDAKKEKPGQFFLAEGGTVFLDEIGNTSETFQIKLLRFLQEREFTPLGGTRPVKANVRIIAATNQDLLAMVQNGEFRQDLFYRINVVRLHLPPLKERKEDIPLLVEHFIQKQNKINSGNIQGISQNALALLMTYDYPGNIRELENIVEYAFVLCSQDYIQEKDLPDYLQGLSSRSRDFGNEGLESSVRELEAKNILDTLEKNDYNRTLAAEELGIHKSTLYRKIKKYGIQI